MNKIKLLIIAFLVVVLTGCSASYEVEIVNNKIIEKTSIVDTDSFRWNQEMPKSDEDTDVSDDKNITYRDYINNLYKNPFPAFSNRDNIFYNKKKISNKSQLGFSYNYTYDFSNYSYSNIVNSCYRYFNVLEEKDLYIISTDKTINCFSYDDLDSITVHLKTNHKVANHNASRVDGYNYYWTFTDVNKDNANIYIELYKDKYVFNYENSITKILIGLIILAILAFIVIIILRKKAKNRNKI